MRLYGPDHVPTEGIVVQRGIMCFWIPSSMAKELRYNPRHVPAIITNVVFQEDIVRIWQWRDCKIITNVQTFRLAGWRCVKYWTPPEET